MHIARYNGHIFININHSFKISLSFKQRVAYQRKISR